MNTKNSWSIKDTEVAKELIDLLDISEEEKAVLKKLQPQANELAEQLTAEFYNRVYSKENTLQYVEDKKLEDLKRTLHNWFLDLFSGVYDEEYANKRIIIGKIHVKIGLPVRYPLAMIDLIQYYGEKVAESEGEIGKRAFRKILALDIAVFNQAYEDNQLQHLSELMGNERLARRLLQGDM